MTERKRGPRPPQYPYRWTREWLRQLPVPELELLAQLARQQFERRAQMTTRNEKLARLTLAEHERRRQVACGIGQAA